MSEEQTNSASASNGCGFLLVWAYLMILAIALAPVVAMMVRGVDK